MANAVKALLLTATVVVAVLLVEWQPGALLVVAVAMALAGTTVATKSGRRDLVPPPNVAEIRRAGRKYLEDGLGGWLGRAAETVGAAAAGTIRATCDVLRPPARREPHPVRTRLETVRRRRQIGPGPGPGADAGGGPTAATGAVTAPGAAVVTAPGAAVTAGVVDAGPAGPGIYPTVPVGVATTTAIGPLVLAAPRPLEGHVMAEIETGAAGHAGGAVSAVRSAVGVVADAVGAVAGAVGGAGGRQIGIGHAGHLSIAAIIREWESSAEARRYPETFIAWLHSQFVAAQQKYATHQECVTAYHGRGPRGHMRVPEPMMARFMASMEQASQIEAAAYRQLAAEYAVYVDQAEHELPLQYGPEVLESARRAHRG